MSGIIDNLLVGLVLLISLGYAAASLGPRSFRKRMLQTLSRWMGRAPAFLGLKSAAQRLGAASVTKAQGACGGCDDCGSEAAPDSKASPSEINVPVGKISRRVRP
jgi:hypothetical protein